MLVTVARCVSLYSCHVGFFLVSGNRNLLTTRDGRNELKLMTDGPERLAWVSTSPSESGHPQLFQFLITLHLVKGSVVWALETSCSRGSQFG